MTLLGDFLKARRGRIGPADAGLPSLGRRRVPGLRRDELAGLAGLSEHYLTRLEQGVDRHPSPQVLRSLARALRLDPDEAAHLFTLARADPPPVSADSPVTPDLQELLDSWPDSAAYVRNRRFDVLAGNKAALALAPMYSPGHNLVRDIFLDPAARTLFPDWATVAAQTAAALRAEADLTDPRVVALVGELSVDADFRRLWALHDVRPTRAERKEFEHPVYGPLSVRRQTLTVAGAEDQVIIVYSGDVLPPR
ncbi:helix-turn-helix transcriptional regulator [Actinoplanes sp. NBRC 103695]|uniref:helix-turn-helix domain-containing protein n=1 Tax=Actinoplanes sp. NBRC 103695 TaxID=3032202 RepID=UPI0024A233C2|nr:helix-turn-helix transcriptional regulator [Actinoplanes sp. NBRC 103695]GLY94891.1 transcriptional regulator [Actinoplanes sp. NBRC 103695]